MESTTQAIRMDLAIQARATALFCCCILCLATLSSLVQGISTTCRIKTTGKSGILTCEFSKNIAETKHSFVVLRYDLHADTNPEIILNCFWVPWGLNCMSKDGYDFDKQVTSVLHVDMPTLTREMEGRYVCQVVGNDDADDKPCSYSFTESLAEETSTASRSTIVPQVQENSEGQYLTPIITSTVAVTVVLLALILTLVFVIRGRKRIRKSVGNVIRDVKGHFHKPPDHVEQTDNTEEREPAGKPPVREQQPLLSKNDPEAEAWCTRERLPPETIRALKDQNLMTIDGLRRLAVDDIPCHFLKNDLLSLANCIVLMKAIGRLSDSAPSGSTLPSHQVIDPPMRELVTDPPEVREGTELDQFRFLVLGITGSGKSTTGNTILGKDLFPSGLSLTSITSKCELKRCNRMGKEIEIMDTPGVFDTDRPQTEICADIVRAVACWQPGPHAVLFVVRLGYFSMLDLSCYVRLKALFDDSITKFIFVLFTGGDEMEKNQTTFSDLMKTARKELVSVIRECGNRSIVFNNKIDDPVPQVQHLLERVQELKQQNGGPYLCPMYKTFGKGLEEEVSKKLAMAEKKELEKTEDVSPKEKKIK